MKKNTSVVKAVSYCFLACLLLLAEKVSAQNTLDLAGLSSSSPAKVAFSLRKLSSSYSGSAIQVRRSSDNATQDIGFDGSGNLDQSALLTFVGTGGTDNGFIAKWYDQSGNANDAVQSTSGSQPQIVSAGVVLTAGSRATIKFNGTTFIDGGTSAYSISSGGHTLSAVYNFQSGTVQHIIDRAVSGNPLTSITGSNQGQYRNDAGTLQTVGSTQSAPFSNTFTATWDASNNINHYKNGVNDYSGTISLPTTLDLMRIGKHFSITGTAVLNIWEVILFPSAISTNERKAMECNQQVYYGITTMPAAITGNTTLSTAITTTLADATGGGTWSSTSTGVATIGSSTGVVTGVSAGTSVISYTMPSGCVATATVTVNTPQNGLIFDGTDDRVNLGSPLLSTTDGTLPYTVEMWVKATTTGTRMGLFTQYVSPGAERWGIEITTTGKLATFNHGVMTSTATVGDGQWHHIAWVKQSGGAVQFFIDGIADVSTTDAVAYSNANTMLGNYGSATLLPLVGTMDEVRVWNIARTQSQIQNNMNCDVAAQANLVAYYRFNQGTASGTNTSIPGAFDYSGNGNCGTITNFALTGSSSNYVTGAVGNCSTISDATPGTFSGNTPVCVGSSITLGNANTGGIWSTASGNITINSTSGLVTGVAAGTATVNYTLNCSTSSATVTVNALPVVAAITGNTTVSTAITTDLDNATGGGVWTSAATGTATINSTTGVVTGVSAGTALISYTVTTSGCSTTVTTNVTVKTPNNALHVDGSNDYVSIPNNSALNISSNITIESWIKITNTSTNIQNVVCKSQCSGSNNGYIFPRTDNAWTNMNGYLHIAGSWRVLTGPAPSANVWHHCALTYNGSTILMYIDGVQVASMSQSGSITTNSNPLSIGVQVGCSSEHFGGAVDEVKIWNTARSQSQIQADMNCDAAQNANLVAYYRFDEGTASGTNTGITTVVDYSGNSLCGTLNNLALTGSTSNYITGAIGSCNTITLGSPGSFSGNSPVCVGSTITLGNANTGGTWSTASSNVTVNSTTGVVTGVNAGTTATVNYTLNCSTSSVTVTVNAKPTITSVTPLVGYPASSVTLVGTGFDATTTNNIVYFGATQATVTAAATTTLTVTVPTGATFAPITVKTSVCNRMGYSQAPYLPSYDNSAFVANTVNFATKVDFAGGTFTFEVGVGDLDGDGKADLAVVDHNNTNILVYRNTGSSGSITAGSFTLSTTLTGVGGLNGQGVHITDIDGDGKPDITASAGASDMVSVYRNTSSGAGSISFASRLDFAAGNNPDRLQVNDVDLDGRPDITVANFDGSAIAVLRNTSSVGSVSFASFVTFAVGSNPVTVRMGDLDGDGKPDLAVTNRGSANITVYRNTSTSGTISLSSASTTSTGTTPESLEIADIDGDGKLDIAVVNSGSNTLSVLRNTSSGSITFAAKVDHTTAAAPWGITVGDFDGNGKPDLATGNFTDDNSSVFLNNSTSGTITLTAKTDFAVTNTGAFISAGDLDGDGRTDLIVPNYLSGSFSILRNNPLSPITGTLTVNQCSTTTLSNATAGGTWSSSNTSVATVGSTGIVTGVAGGTVTITYAGTAGTSFTNNIVTATVTVNSTAPTITSVTPLVGYPASSVTIVGTNFDATTTNNIVYFGATQATVTAAATTTLTVTVPTGATFAPITVATSACGLTGQSQYPYLPYYDNSAFAAGQVNLAAKFDMSSGTTPYSIAIGDVDGDGKPDMAVSDNSSDRIRVYRNISTSGTLTSGSFSTSVSFVTGSTPRGVYLNDVNGDGKLDMIIVNSGVNSFSVFRNTASSGSITSGSFAARADFTTASSPLFAAVGDIDGDGRPEIVVSNNGGANVSLFRNTSSSGSVSFAAKVDFASGGNARSVAIGDVDGDGKADLAVGNGSGNTISIFRNTATSGTISSGSFAAKVDISATSPVGLVLADIDGDGKMDLSTAQGGGGTTLSVFRNTGSSGTISFASAATFTHGTNAGLLAAGDINGDGKADLVVTNRTSTTISVLRNTSTSGLVSFSGKTDFSTGNSDPQGIAIGDLDGDELPDIVVTNNGTTNISIYRNDPLSPITGPLTVNQCSTTTLSNATAGGTWSSSNTGIATVNSTSGVVTGVSGGTVTIIYAGTAGASFTGNIVTTTVTVNSLSPTITSVTPLVGYPASSVTIVGTNFDPTTTNNIVYFGATQAMVTAAATTTLTVTVPTGATFSPVTVVTNNCGLMAFSSGQYLPNYDNSAFVANKVNFNSKVDFTGVGAGYGIAIGDIDGDGKADMIMTNSAGTTISVFRNTSSSGTITSGSFAARVDLTITSAPHGVKVHDVDGDGKLDIIAGDAGANRISILRNTSTSGSVSFATRVDYTTGASSTPVMIAIGDIDGDGRPEIATTNNTSGNISVYRNTCSVGTISFDAKVDFTQGNGANGIVLVDLDGDGKLDMAAVNNGGTAKVGVFRNTATAGVINSSSFATRVDYSHSFAYDLAAGDVDGDGKPELVVCNTSSLSLLQNNSTPGTISFGSAVGFSTGTSPQRLAMGDVDGDGKVDIAVSSSFSSVVSIHRNTAISGTINGSSLASMVNFTSGNNPQGVAVGDLDGDGKADIITANNGAGTVSVLRNNPLSAITGTTVVCVGATTTLSNATAGGTWVSGATGTATVNSASGVVTGVAGGTAVISYVGTAASTNADNIVTVNITVNALPTVNAASVAICVGGSTGLTASGASSYIWAPAATLSASTGASVTATPTVTTVYTITGTDALSCSNAATVTVTVTPYSGVYSITGGGPYCSGTAGATIGLSNSDVGYNYQLIKGGTTLIGSPVAGTGAAISFGAQPLAGLYTATVTSVAAPGCANSMSGSTVVSILTSPAPVAMIGGGSVCGGGPGVMVGLAGSAIGIQYQLYRGGSPVGGPVPGAGTSINFGTFTTLGTYTAIATNTVNACTSNMTGSAIINAAAGITTYTVTGTGSYCAGGTGITVGQNGSTSGISYQLFLGSTAVGSPVTGTGSAISFGLQTTAGTYTVVGTNTSTGCFATMTGSAVITIDPLPNIHTVTGGGAYCSGGAGVPVGLSLSQTGVDYQLYLGASPSGSPVAGTGSALSFTCTNTMGGSVTVSINPLPSVSAGGAAAICNGSSTGLTASGAVDYAWAPAASLSASTGSSVTASPSSTITYTVTGTDANGCVNTSTVTVTVNALPTVSGGSDVAICNGASTGLTASGASTYTWDPAAGLSATTGASVTATPTVTTTYTVTGTDANGCVNSATVIVTVNPIPTVSGGSNTAVCNGFSTLLTASGATTYTWTPSTGLSATTGTSVTASPTVAVTYTVTGNALGCTNTATVTVSVNSIPSYNAGANVAICAGTSTSLAASELAAGNAITFPGSGNNYVTIPNTANLKLMTSNFTVSAWIYATSTSGAQNIMYHGLGCSSWSSWHFVIGGSESVTFANKIVFGFRTSNGAGLNEVASPSDVPINTWTQITGTYDGSNLRLYVNGSLVATAAASGTPWNSGENLYLGMDPGCSGRNRFTGKLDGLQIWNTTRSASDVATYYNQYVAPGTSGIIGSWVFDESSGTTITDLSSASNNGSIVGSLTREIPSTAPIYGSGSSAYAWAPSATLSSATGTPVTASPTVTTTYTVTGTDANGCSNTASVTVTVNVAPTIGVSPSVAICTGSSTALTATGGISYTWAPATGLSATTGASVTANPTTTTTYTVTGANAGGCTNMATVTVTVNPLPTVAASAGGIYCSGSSTTVTASGSTSYTWTPATNLSATTGANVTASPTVTTTYTVTGTDANGCSNTATVV
ncbi:MAG: type sorting protein, partial [Flavipsychrobacter sp.]|nr:type sorting protein [Flavipsychrobacter sp.]